MPLYFGVYPGEPAQSNTPLSLNFMGNFRQVRVTIARLHRGVFLFDFTR